MFLLDNKSLLLNLSLILKNKYSVVIEIVKEIYFYHGKAFIIGGAVRDTLLGKSIGDIDIEVHGLSIDRLQEILLNYGQVIEIGKSFGVLRLAGLDIDWSIARIDSKGRKPKVDFCLNISIKDALARRDLTINSIAVEINPCGYMIHDPFNGIEDLKNNILRATDSIKFSEDPLRFFRVVRYISVLQMHPDKQLVEICKNMDLSEIAQERVTQEYIKMFNHSEVPSLGLRWLNEIGLLEKIVPELKNLNMYFNSFFSSIDAYAFCVKKEREIEFFVALIGYLFIVINKHEYLPGFLKKILGLAGKKYIKKIYMYARYYKILEKPLSLTDIKLYAYELSNVSLSLKKVALFSYCIKPDIDLFENFLVQAKSVGVENEPEKAILSGKDIRDTIPQSKIMGKIIYDTYIYQITHSCRDINLLKAYAIKQYHLIVN